MTTTYPNDASSGTIAGNDSAPQTVNLSPQPDPWKEFELPDQGPVDDEVRAQENAGFTSLASPKITTKGHTGAVASETPPTWEIK